VADSRIQTGTELFVIPLLDRYLVYAPLRQLAFIVSAEAVNLLCRLQRGETAAGNGEEQSFLRFCDKIGLMNKEGDLPVGDFESPEFRPYEVTLFLTNKCNLRCVYCYASAGEQPVAMMDIKTAQRGIDYVCRNALESGKPGFSVGYHGGGEPTTHWDVLTGSLDYARRLSKENGLELDAAMASNGCFTPEQRLWIINNLSGVNLSVDGLPLVQDRQRPAAFGGPSSEAVMQTIREFDSADFHYGLRLTVTSESVEYLPASVEYLMGHSRPKHIQLEPMYVLGRGRGNGLAVDPHAFIDAYRLAKKIAAQGNADLFYSAARVELLTSRFCLSCGEGFSLTPQGLVSACYEAPDAGFEFAGRFIFGRYEESSESYIFDQEKLASLRNHTVENIPWCRDCFCKWHCAGDCHYKSLHSMTDGHFTGDTRCEITRALTLDQILENIRQSGGTVWSGSIQQDGLPGESLTSPL
jgi:uncharacterized protein